MNISPLNTDFYELKMMAGLFGQSKLEDTATFDLYFRRIPFQGGFAIAAGLETAVATVENLRFVEEELDYLRSLDDGRKVFDPAFIAWLKNYRFQGDIWGIPEGSLVFHDEPLVRVSGRLAECMLLETMLLCLVNFQTLIATKAARLWEVSGRSRLLEFGLRRAHGLEAGLLAARAAFIGGAEATSNTHAARTLGIPAAGTHAHGWVMSFPTELEAFRIFAETFPHQCVLLVDTYDVLRSGVPNAITVAREMKARGRQLQGIRIDSGDLAYLSRAARKMLDEAGVPEVKIIASNDLEEAVIEEIILSGGRVDVWGVGTQLVTGGGTGGGALGGVYKLVEHNGHPTIKLSDNIEKSTSPGRKQVYRLSLGDFYEADAVVLETEQWAAPHDALVIDPRNPLRRKRITAPSRCEPLLVQVMKDGRRVREPDSIQAARQRRIADLDRLDSSYKRLINPHSYKVGVSQALWELKEELLNRQTV